MRSYIIGDARAYHTALMMNNLAKVILLAEKIEHFCFGLALLHAMMRFIGTFSI